MRQARGNICQLTGVPPLPVSEKGLLHFVACGVNQGLKHQTIKSYISAIRHLQVSVEGGDPKVGNMPQLELALRGTRKEQVGLSKRTCLPIIPSILLRMHKIWEQQASGWDHIMLWAACCLGFFGFLRSGELTAPDRDDFDPGQHLTFSDMAVDDPSNPKTIAVRIKQSKKDPFQQGVTIFLGRTDTALPYLALRGPGDGPLFRFKDGRALTRSRLVTAIREALAKAGLKPEEFAGHNFRIGVATTAAACGLPVDLIKTLGRWRSQAYQLYVRLPRNHLAAVSSTLAAAEKV